MNKKELVNAYARKYEISKSKAKIEVDRFIELSKELLTGMKNGDIKDDNINIPTFGKFYIHDRKELKCVLNENLIVTPPKRVAKFKPSRLI